jgi:hypothetical protein
MRAAVLMGRDFKIQVVDKRTGLKTNKYIIIRNCDTLDCDSFTEVFALSSYQTRVNTVLTSGETLTMAF